MPPAPLHLLHNLLHPRPAPNTPLRPDKLPQTPLDLRTAAPAALTAVPARPSAPSRLPRPLDRRLRPSSSLELLHLGHQLSPTPSSSSSLTTPSSSPLKLVVTPSFSDVPTELIPARAATSSSSSAPTAPLLLSPRSLGHQPLPAPDAPPVTSSPTPGRRHSQPPPPPL